MNRLRQPGDSDYDVLGLSPGATDQEIDRAFRQLIDGEGYRVGVPLNRQWLRARQIKEAHARLADPKKRRAYDKSLARTAEPAPWTMTANDPGTDELVLPEQEPIAPRPVKPEIAPEPEEEQALRLADDDSPATELDPALGDHEPASVRSWGAATAAIVGLGALILAFWPAWDGEPTGSAPEEAAGPATWAEPGLGSTAPQAPISLEGAPASEAPGMLAGEPPGAPDASGRPSDGQAASDQPTPQDAATPAATNRAEADATGPAATGAGASAEAAEVQASAPAEPTVAAAPMVARSSGNSVRTPAQWVGGGPTDADNRRGRYQGTVAVQIHVDPNGRVSNCAPVRGSGNAGLDALTCSLVRQRARFTPALDAEGRPVASEAYTTFVWGSRRQN
jgi:protein TonB